MFRFLRAGSRRRVVDEFHDWYVQRFSAFEPDDDRRRLYRPSIIAHSFGSYVVGECMLKYREVKFDKIILCGSILPKNFDWTEVLARNQVWNVRNEFGLKDRWAKLVGSFMHRSGESGYSGFTVDSHCVEQERFAYHAHSDYFKIGHCLEYWLPFLERPRVAVELRHGHEIQDEREFVKILNRTHDIDTECFAHLPGYARVEIPRGLSTSWIRINPDIYTFLIDVPGNRPVGYVNAMPLQEPVFRRIISGKLDDNEVGPDDLLPYDSGKPVWLYLMSIAIEPSARRVGQGIFQEGFERLMAGLEEKILDYWRRFGTRVREIGATGWTPEGRRICEALGLIHRGSDRQGNPIFSLVVDEAESGKGRLGGLIRRLRDGYTHVA